MERNGEFDIEFVGFFEHLEMKERCPRLSHGGRQQVQTNDEHKLNIAHGVTILDGTDCDHRVNQLNLFSKSQC